MSKEDCNQASQLNVGDHILRCWSDGNEYPAIVFKKTAIHYMLYYRETNELEEVLVTSFQEGSEWRRCTPATTANSKLAANIKGTVDQRNDTPTAKNSQNDANAKIACENSHVREVTTKISTDANNANDNTTKESPAKNTQNDASKVKTAPEDVHVQNVMKNTSTNATEAQNKAVKDESNCKYKNLNEITRNKNMKYGSEPYAPAQDIVSAKLSTPAISSKSALLLCAGSLMGIVGLSLGFSSFKRR